MNTSKLTVGQQCKALADAAEYNKLKANIILAKSRSRALSKGEREAYKSHMNCVSLFLSELTRLQKNTQYRN